MQMRRGGGQGAVASLPGFFLMTIFEQKKTHQVIFPQNHFIFGQAMETNIRARDLCPRTLLVPNAYGHVDFFFFKDHSALRPFVYKCTISV